MKLLNIILLTLCVLCSTCMVEAKSKVKTKADPAKTLFNEGKYYDAITELQKQRAKNPQNAQINEMLGISLYKIGQTTDARQYLDIAARKGSAKACIYMAHYCYNEYNFLRAEELIDKAGDINLNADDNELLERIRKAREMYDHVEKIVVFDSLVVAKDTFFKAYKLSPETGEVLGVSELPFTTKDVDSHCTAFISDNKENAIWSQSEGDNLHLFETTQLLSGEWDSPHSLSAVLNEDGDSNYPFMMPDGQTFYYASNGDASIGGYDIFISRKDTEEGTYMPPQNVGMPYNSPYDDYLLVIDEENGIGWWASDRNQIEDSVTIYLFLPNAIRENYSTSEHNLSHLAALNDIKLTWPEDFDATTYINKVNSIRTERATIVRDFEFEVKPGVIYTSMADVKTKIGKEKLQQYLDTVKEQERDKEKLSTLRNNYAISSAGERKAMTTTLLQLERKIDDRYAEIKKIANDVRKAEQANR